MKILYVTSSFPYGDWEAFLLTELREIECAGHEVTIVPAFGRGTVVHDDALPLLPRTRRMPLLSPGAWASVLREIGRAPGRGARAAARLRESRSPRILAKNAAVLPKAFWLAGTARRLGIDHIHAHWAGTSGTLAMIAAELAEIPWSLTVHRWDIREDNLLRRKVESASFVRAISEDGLRDLRRIAGPTATPTPVIHVGVALPAVAREREAAPPGSPLRLLVPANLYEVKGHRYLVQALALLRERGVPVAAAFAGQGYMRPQLEAQIASLGLGSDCRLLGQVAHAELLRQIAAGSWDVVALPSVVTASGEKEGIPVALLEAMSHGVPVIGTDAGGVPELVTDGSGLLVPPGDAAALADAIERVARDAGLRERLGRQGRERVERDFAAPAVARELLARMEATLPRS